MESYNYNQRIPFFKQHWVLPILLAILFLPILILLPWQTQKVELEDRQEQLIADTLWLEQGIRTMLVKDEENIQLIGDDITSERTSTDQVQQQFLTLLENHPEIQQLVWLGEHDQILYSPHPSSLVDFSLNSKQAIQHARASGVPQYAQPSAVGEADGVMFMDYHYPLFSHQKYVGSIVASYRLSTILDKVVPWWFAKDHEISLIDLDDTVVANRADGGPGKNVFTHSKNLDLFGANLTLKTNNTKSFPKLLPNYLVGAVILLGIGLTWSLWALWRDILRRQTTEAALRSEFAFRKAMEKSLVTGLRLRDMNGKLIYVNSAFCEMIGYSEEQLIGQSAPFSFWTTEACEEFSKPNSSARRRAALDGFETAYIHASGRKIPVLIYESAMLDENGIQTGWMGSILDISEKKRAEQVLRQHEERLQRSSRLSTMGEMASVMAHELNQPLTAISIYASGAANMVKSKHVDFDELQPALEQMQKHAFRAAQIIRSVHDFVAKRGPNRTQMPFNEVFKNVLPLIEMQAKSFLIRLEIDFPSDLPDVYVDPISLEQVILNLTRNALQSMQELTLPNRVLRIGANQKRNFICVEVTDKGAGVSPEVASRLFSPFFSTKAEGMGMGLNICRTIIEFHGGQLSHRSNPEGGTIFSFTVPTIIETKYQAVSIVG